MHIDKTALGHVFRAWGKQGIKGALLVLAIWFSLSSRMDEQGEELKKLRTEVQAAITTHGAEIQELKTALQLIEPRLTKMEHEISHNYIRVINAWLDTSNLWQQRILEEMTDGNKIGSR